MANTPRTEGSRPRSLLLLVSCMCLVATGCTAATGTDRTEAAGLVQQQLEIHHINVQQGDCTLIVGPDGTTFLIDAGNAGRGTAEVVPYLQAIGIQPADELDFMLASHRDADHLGGLDEVIQAGYQVRSNVWDNGSTKTGGQIDEFVLAAQGTTAGPVQQMPLGHVVQLGGGATATCVTVGGQVLGHGAVTGATEENDLSVAILVRFGDFEYLTGGDLGGGDDDRSCTGRRTDQANVESPLAIPGSRGGREGLMVPAGGRIVLGRNGDPAQNGGYTANYVYTGMNLANNDDEILLIDLNGRTMDRVAYTGSAPWPDPTGRSMQLQDVAGHNEDASKLGRGNDS